MEYRTLGNTGIEVSVICLGTMTWGEQNTKDEAFLQLDYALDKGVNFIDTAEAYSIPIKAETQGSTETIIGKWIKNRGKRDDFILASKIAGPSPATAHIRGGSKFVPDHIDSAITHSLKRLQTDYIDLYQLHWPERPTNFFGQLGYQHKSDEVGTDFKVVLEALKKHIDAGRIRYVGLSNETPWGLMKFLQLAEEYDLPRVVSVQNPYSLVNRTYEVGLAEISIREKCGLLAYSPLAGGILSGKYRNGNQPDGARFTLWPNYITRYNHDNVTKSVEAYAEVADKHGMSLTQLSLAFVNQQDFVTSNIIGATTMDQLKENIGSINIHLGDDVLKEIENIHGIYTYPSA